MKDIDFKRPELEDKEIISSYFAKAPSRSCERTFANVYLWSRHYHVKYAIVKTRLFLWMTSLNLHMRIRRENRRQ